MGIEMSGKYFVDVSRMNDVSKLLGMLSGYTKTNWVLPTKYLFINIENRSVFKSTDSTANGFIGAYKRVGYDDIINILEDEVLKELDAHIETKSTIGLFKDVSIKEYINSTDPKDYTNSNLLILNDYLKNGTKIQFNISGTQWHNVTGKFKLEQLKHKSMKLRYKPECVEVDGVMMKPDAAIKYINKHYNMEDCGE